MILSAPFLRAQRRAHFAVIELRVLLRYEERFASYQR